MERYEVLRRSTMFIVTHISNSSRSSGAQCAVVGSINMPLLLERVSLGDWAINILLLRSKDHRMPK